MGCSIEQCDFHVNFGGNLVVHMQFQGRASIPSCWFCIWQHAVYSCVFIYRSLYWGAIKISQIITLIFWNLLFYLFFWAISTTSMHGYMRQWAVGTINEGALKHIIRNGPTVRETCSTKCIWYVFKHNAHSRRLKNYVVYMSWSWSLNFTCAT
jgi:hypothetical protein